jgi:hypothetical protein
MTRTLLAKLEPMADQAGREMTRLYDAGDLDGAIQVAGWHGRLTRLVSYLMERAER